MNTSEDQKDFLAVTHEAVLTACMDDRYHPEYAAALLEAIGVKTYFLIANAGGGGRFSKLDHGPESANDLPQIKLAIKEKGAKIVIAATHVNGCAGYAAGEFKFDDQTVEETFHAAEAQQIKERLEKELRGEFPDITIITGYFRKNPDTGKAQFVVVAK